VCALDAANVQFREYGKAAEDSSRNNDENG
jgi:hypothetical protein